MASQSGRPSVRVHATGVRADLATVVPRGSPQDTAAAAALQNRELLYLGQNDGTAVLFDPQEKRAIYLQASDIVMRRSRPRPETVRPPHCQPFDIAFSWRVPGCGH
jgi:hypothetical protein